MAIVMIHDRQVNVEQWNESALVKLVCLHGFTGTTTSWRGLAKLLPNVHVIALDMVGHGKSDCPSDVAMYEMSVQLALIEGVMSKLEIESFYLLGYSMGGRIALSYTVNYPQRVKGLLLESATAGIAGEQDRRERQQADRTLATKIERLGVEQFVNEWENIPLFATQRALPESIRAAIRAERLSQRAEGLANSLRGIGTGMMPSVWEELPNVTMPVHLLVGQLDTKFVEIAKIMQQKLVKANVVIFKENGHAIHVENLAMFATIVEETISKIEEDSYNDNTSMDFITYV